MRASHLSGQMQNGLSPSPYTNRKSKSKRRKSFYSCSCFFFCRYVGFAHSICSRSAANPKSAFFASGNPSRSNSIYCRFAPIRYEINPSFAKQTYLAEGISSCVSNISKIPRGIYLAACSPLRITRILKPCASGRNPLEQFLRDGGKRARNNCNRVIPPRRQSRRARASCQASVFAPH